MDIPIIRYTTIVVGTGCAGWNAADTLHSLGHTDVAIVTEGILMGTSRNTGSDKQTYYKLTTAGSEPDSVLDMAQTLFAGGSMNGDLALVESALSLRCFYKLVGLGVPFPHTVFGEYVGYKTDHDPRQRATSCGPLTSKRMTEQLQKSAEARGIPVYDGYRVIRIIRDESKAVGLLALRVSDGSLTLFNCTNIVYATGGASGMYQSSVYPESQTGAMGAAFAAGVKGINLTEAQFGIASIGFRWNLSGTYQQVIPTYLSTDQDGDNAVEFLDAYFGSTGEMLDAIFLKGYQWPFDPRKLGCGGSSIVDIAVFAETKGKGRRVFLDYRRNPVRADSLDSLGSVARAYLENSHAMLATPVERLNRMNPLAYELYLAQGIDLQKDRLEIDVCAQHHNGGLLGDIWYESNLKHFFPVGEVNGVFGVYRPGGSALNSTQVGSLRAAQYIAANYTDTPMEDSAFWKLAAKPVEWAKQFIRELAMPGGEKPLSIRKKMRQRMDDCGSFIRKKTGIAVHKDRCRNGLPVLGRAMYAVMPRDILDAFVNYDILLTQFVYLSAFEEYIAQGGKSRGSYLIMETDGFEQSDYGFPVELDDGTKANQVCEVLLDGDALQCSFDWKAVRPIPSGHEEWFENVYNEYLTGKVIAPLHED